MKLLHAILSIFLLQTFSNGGLLSQVPCGCGEGFSLEEVELYSLWNADYIRGRSVLDRAMDTEFLNGREPFDRVVRLYRFYDRERGFTFVGLGFRSDRVTLFCGESLNYEVVFTCDRELDLDDPLVVKISKAGWGDSARFVPLETLFAKDELVGFWAFSKWEFNVREDVSKNGLEYWVRPGDDNFCFLMAEILYDDSVRTGLLEEGKEKEGNGGSPE